MSNRRHGRQIKPAHAPAATDQAQLEPRPFAAQEPQAAPAPSAPAGSAGHAFANVQAPQGNVQAPQGEVAQLTSAEQRPNRTGLPDALKAGVESLSGMSLDDVKVHYSSAEPAQLGALAYAQGTDIHLAPGEEEHLPHEAWHVVQQAQGRVKPTIQLKGETPVNDDAGLEHEADVMGRKALASAADPAQLFQRDAGPAAPPAASPIQLKKLTTMGGTFDTGQYEAVTGPAEVKGGDHIQDVGGVIDMSFSPTAEVTGKYGLVQTAKAIRNKRPDFNKDRTDLQERMQGEQGSDPGRFMDRSKYKENPIFGLQNQAEVLGSMADGQGIDMRSNRNAVATRAEGASGKGTPGIIAKEADEEDHNISDVGGKVGEHTPPADATPASMRDEPQRTRHLAADEQTGDAISMEFETAALVLSGDMEGTYLGSVQWGFEIAEADKAAKPLPFAIVSMGTPTPAFMESANAWNDQAIISTDSTGKNTTQSLPVHATKHAPDLELQKLLADESADKAKKIEALQARIALLTRAQEAMDPANLRKLKQAVDEANANFEQAKREVDAMKQERRDVARTLDPLRAERQTAGKKVTDGQADLAKANSDLDRIGNKTPFYKARKAKDEAAVKAATAKLAELDKALAAAREAVAKAEADLARLEQGIAGFNKSDAAMGQREARINLQNEKADLANVSFELAHMLKALDTLQSE
jgi:hypothetical protein